MSNKKKILSFYFLFFLILFLLEEKVGQVPSCGLASCGVACGLKVPDGPDEMRLNEALRFSSLRLRFFIILMASEVNFWRNMRSTTSFLRVMRSPMVISTPPEMLHTMEQHRITVVRAKGRTW